MPPEPIIYQRAARMRRSLTPPEARLWACLKSGRLEGVKFRRQHPIGDYILDFYCSAAKVAIEVDGSSHEVEAIAEADARRTAWLERQGIRVIRFPAVMIRGDLDGVMRAILTAVSQR